MKVNLPRDLQGLIFGELEARYQRDYSMVQCNLDASTNDLRIYLGTYFPRSYAEAYVIAGKLMENCELRKAWMRKQQIRILDLGSGTGGALLGFLQGLRKKLSFGYKQVKVLSLDGNNMALDLQQRLIHGYAGDMQWCSQQLVITCIDDFRSSVKNVARNIADEYDVILCFKFLNEMYRGKVDNNEIRYYAGLMELAEDLLGKDGILVLSEVTDQLPTGEYIPNVIACEQAAYVQQGHHALRCILPVSCGRWGGCCQIPSKCFTQQVVYVNHQKAQNDCSKFSYRVMARRLLAEKVLASVPTADIYCVFLGKDGGHAVFCQHGQCEWLDSADANGRLQCHEAFEGYCIKGEQHEI